MCLHECKLKFFKEKYHEKWENAYLIFKNVSVQGPKSGPKPPLIFFPSFM